MKKIYILFGLFLPSLMGVAQVKIENSSRSVFNETPQMSTGLNNIYVMHDINGATISYTSSTSSNKVTWYKYGSQGGGYAEEITNIVRDGAVTSLQSIIPNSGYIIEDENRRTYFWVVNYSDYYLNLGDITYGSNQDCGSTILDVTGFGPNIIYYTINGQQKILDRELVLTYTTQGWDRDNTVYNQILVEEKLPTFKNSIAISAPFANTQFVLSGDRFLKYWDQEEKVVSNEYFTNAVAVEATATQQGEKPESNLGGSAPIDIEFKGFFTDAVIYKEWQIASDTEFEKILYKFNEETINHSFIESGTFYVRFKGSNNVGSCDAFSETFTVSIGESKLECPNAFSPQSTEGVNDEWKVSYKSIVSFKCSIFNRWGVEMINFKDPSLGWDGKYNGKYVDAGVYFYVIEAKGADGKDYLLRGDINIINFRKK